MTFEGFWKEYRERITSAGELERGAAEKAWNTAIREAYIAARGTGKLKDRGNSQMYWKGRADASNDVRALEFK